MPSGTPRVKLDLGQQWGHRLEGTRFNPQMPEALRTQADCSEAQTKREQEGDDFATSFPFAASAAIS